MHKILKQTLRPKKIGFQKMQKIKNHVLLIVGLILLCLYCKESVADTFHLSQGTYALCTKAKCFPIPGQEGKALCHCTVEEGYSAGEKPGEKVKTISNGK